MPVLFPLAFRLKIAKETRKLLTLLVQMHCFDMLSVLVPAVELLVARDFVAGVFVLDELLVAYEHFFYLVNSVLF